MFYFFGSKVAPCDFGFEKKSQAKNARECLGGPSVVFSDKNAQKQKAKKEQNSESPLGHRKNDGLYLLLSSETKVRLLKT